MMSNRDSGPERNHRAPVDSTVGQVNASNKPGVFTFFSNGSIVIPRSALRLTPPNTDQTIASPEELGRFNEDLTKFYERLHAQDIHGLVAGCIRLREYALKSEDPEIERKAIEAISLKQHILSGTVRNPIGIQQICSWDFNFKDLALRYLTRGRNDFAAGLAAAHFITGMHLADYDELPLLKARIGAHKLIEHKLVDESGESVRVETLRGFELHEFSKGLLLSGEPGAVGLAMNEITQSIGKNYDSPKVISWLLWKFGSLFTRADYTHNCLAYHLCRNQPTWPLNIPKILDYVIDHSKVTPSLSYLSRWRERRSAARLEEQPS